MSDNVHLVYGIIAVNHLPPNGHHGLSKSFFCMKLAALRPFVTSWQDGHNAAEKDVIFLPDSAGDEHLFPEFDI